MFGRIIRCGWSVVCSTCNGWREHDGTLFSAATAYYGAFSLFPLCLVLTAGLGFAGRYSTIFQTEQRELLAKISKNVSPWPPTARSMWPRSATPGPCNSGSGRAVRDVPLAGPRRKV